MVVIFDQDFNRERLDPCARVTACLMICSAVLSAHNDKQAMDRAYRIVSSCPILDLLPTWY